MDQQFEIEIIEPTNEAEQVEIIEVQQPIPQIVLEVEECNEAPNQVEMWPSSEDFVDYIENQARLVPAVYQSKNSLRRALAYLENLSNELVDGVQQDANFADLTQQQLERLDNIEQGIETAVSDIVATAQGKITKIATKSSKFTYFVNPLIFSIARILINSKVSQGKNIQSIFEALDNKYKLNDREKLELHFILEDMGYPQFASYVGGIDRAEQYQA
jgi:hypothetical protein